LNKFNNAINLKSFLLKKINFCEFQFKQHIYMLHLKLLSSLQVILNNNNSLELFSLNITTQISNVGLTYDSQVNVVVGLTTLGQIKNQIGVYISDYQLSLVDVRNNCVVVGIGFDLNLMTRSHSDYNFTV